MSAADRSAVREAAVQTVFECEFRKTPDQFTEIFTRNIAAHELDKPDVAFGAAILSAVADHTSRLKEAIAEHAPDWPYDQIARLDRAVLLCGLAELSFLDEKIPPAVTLNEYVEIAKNYGGDPARRFVNGVLSAAKKASETK